MTTSTKICLIVAASLLALGVIFFIAAMAISQFKFAEVFTTASYETATQDINDEFENISINTTTADVTILRSADDSAHVVCFYNKKITYSVAVTDGTLSIEENDERRWFDHISIVSNTPELRVYLPSDEYEALTIDLSTGDVRVEEFTFSSINIDVSTGDIECLASVKGELNIHTTTGDIGISGASAGSMNLKTTTGLVNIFDITCDGDVNIKGTSGRSVLTNVDCKNLTINSGSGASKMINVIASETITINKNTGGVKLEACDAAELNIKTTTGDVVGSLLTEKVFVTNTTTGDISVPKSTSGGICEISTTTGEIDIDIKK